MFAQKCAGLLWANFFLLELLQFYCNFLSNLTGLKMKNILNAQINNNNKLIGFVDTSREILDSSQLILLRISECLRSADNPDKSLFLESSSDRFNRGLIFGDKNYQYIYLVILSQQILFTNWNVIEMDISVYV